MMSHDEHAHSAEQHDAEHEHEHEHEHDHGPLAELVTNTPAAMNNTMPSTNTNTNMTMARSPSW